MTHVVTPAGQYPSDPVSVATSRTIAVIPARNDDRMIGSRVLSCLLHVDAVLVVDEGSTDKTVEVAQLAGAVVIKPAVSHDHATAIAAGLAEAAHMGAKAVVILHDAMPSLMMYIPLVLSPVQNGNADISVVDGYHDHIRAFSAAAIQHFSSSSPTAPASIWEPGVASGLKITRVRGADHSLPKPGLQLRGSRLHGIAHALQHVVAPGPLLLLGVSGLLLLMAGLGLGIHILDLYARTQNLAVGYAMLMVLLCVVGTLFLFSSILLHSTRSMLTGLQRSILERRPRV